jgi:hypothetical protein
MGWPIYLRSLIFSFCLWWMLGFYIRSMMIPYSCKSKHLIKVLKWNVQRSSWTPMTSSFILIIKRTLWFLSLSVRYLNLFSPYIFVSLKNPYSPDVPFGGLNITNCQPGLSPSALQSSVFGHNDNMEDYISQILQLKTNVNRL